MRSLLLQDFAQNIILIPDVELRTPGSKHQQQIKRIQNFIRGISETGSYGLLLHLIEIEPIKCKGETKYVSHCRYLQYCVNYLRENAHNYHDLRVHKDEGKQDG